MTEKTTSQTQQKGFETMPIDLSGVLQTWQQLTDETLTQMAAWLEQTGKLQAAGLEQLSRNVKERAKFFNDSLEQVVRVSDDWRQMAVKAARRAAEIVQR